MGIADRNPGQLVPFSCSSASVAEGAVLVTGAANDIVKLPTAASSSEAFVGLAAYPWSASANSPVDAVVNGVWPAIAAGTIVRGDRLVVGGATGTVVAESLTTPAHATRVGVALESATTGARVAILIGNVPSFSGTVLKMVAGVGGTTANRIVMAANGTAVLPGGASPTAALLGVALNTASAGEVAYVVTSGSAVVTDSGAGVTANDFITAGGTNGTGLTAAPAGGTNCAIVGFALTTTAASGSITVSVRPGRIQG